MLWPSRKKRTAKKSTNRNSLVPNEGGFRPARSVVFNELAIDLILTTQFLSAENKHLVIHHRHSHSASGGWHWLDRFPRIGGGIVNIEQVRVVFKSVEPAADRI